MKKCTYCGLENPDESVECLTCHTSLTRPQATKAEPKGNAGISPEEQLFWEKMTFKDFAILMVRLQAVWLLINAVMYATYLPSYFTRARGTLSYEPLYSQISPGLFFAILRIILNVALALALIQYAERLLRWLVKDSIPKSPPSPSVD